MSESTQGQRQESASPDAPQSGCSASAPSVMISWENTISLTTLITRPLARCCAMPTVRDSYAVEESGTSRVRATATTNRACSHASRRPRSRPGPGRLGQDVRGEGFPYGIAPAALRINDVPDAHFGGHHVVRRSSRSHHQAVLPVSAATHGLDCRI